MYSSSLQYGFINTCLRTLVVDKFGEETWDNLRLSAEVQDTFMTYEVYDDDITLRLVREACRMLDVSSEVVLKLFGEYFFSFCKMSGYDTMLRTLGGNLVEFIENLDALHSYLALSYQEMIAPSFRVERTSDNRTLLHYYSERKGLHPIVPGIIEAVAKDFFGIRVTMSVLEQVEEEEELRGSREHVIFLMTQESEDGQADALLSVQAEEEEGSEGEAGSGRSTCPNPVHGDRAVLQDLQSFCPSYPGRLWIELTAFCNAFPFHIVFDQELVVKQSGVNIQKFVPGLQVPGACLTRFFSVVHPEVALSIPSIKKFINSQFVLKTKRESLPEGLGQQPLLKLRGQMVWMPSLCCMVYLCSPKLRSLHELEERGLHLADIAPHDTTRDLILLNQQRLAEIELSNQLERKKEELRILSRHLEVEKKKTETLLYAMLPRHVANQLKEGKRVEAGEFKVCTILFSDVVTFTNICAACEPIQIVHMLNSMYSKFDHLTNIHDVYKVETIGDAYMVVGGVPIPRDTHAERVANFALGMRIAAREVTNPITGQPIQIRVGLHTGPVLAGVVGEKMPRYCLFGDTVNTASRMESHSVPDRIHLSPFTYRVLKDKEFEICERGEIEVKGKGLMTTYFLLENLQWSEEQIMGRGEGGACVYRDDLQEAAPSPAVQLDERGQEQMYAQDDEDTSSSDKGQSCSSSPLPSPNVTHNGPALQNLLTDYSEPLDKGLLPEGVVVNSRFCTLL
ncbi:guanylate cyclase soluble subunit beta-2 [Brachyhypopomus gauderio]|uniref:guanylate cyclase soluble subunit beta-2 n=1 Tax=Brachyhypopomus gauderio TaxID=698409 RepID=UPI00404107BF